jgi:hypothetical protein
MLASIRKTPEPATKKAKTSRKKLSKQTQNETYLTLKQLYLQENPKCARPGCLHNAQFIHHVCRGTARGGSLLNTDTWLGVCSDECHDYIERLHYSLQSMLKQDCVRETIERLRPRMPD